MEHNFTKGSVAKQLFLFALPILGSNLLQALYGTVDLMVVGLFSDAAEVSAVSTGSMTLQTITGIITGLTMGCTVLIGQYVGSQNKKGAARTIGAGLWLFVTFGILLALLIAGGANCISTVMNAPEEAFVSTSGYIRICGIGVICIVMFNAICGTFRGMGDSNTPLILMGIACVCNVAGDFILVGGLKLGAAGAALATVFAQGISVVSALFLIKKRGFGFPVTKEDLHANPKEMKKILQYGLPIAAQEALTGISFMVILAILNGFGVVASAGVGVAEKICALMFLVPSAVMSAISAFSAQNVGAGSYGRAKRAMFYGMGISFLVGLLMFAVSFFHGQFLAGFFAKEKDIIEAAADYLRSYSVDCVIVGFNFSMMGYLNGNGKTSFVALQGILSTFLVRIPVSYFMSKIPGVTLFQIGFATPLATAFAIIITSIYLVRFEKKRNLNRNLSRPV